MPLNKETKPNQTKPILAQSPWAVEYTDYISAVG